MPQIGSAPNGENSSLAGTEKIALSGSKWAYISTVAEYIRTLTQTLTNKTLTTPTIADFTNATHDHSNAAGGGTISTSVLNSGTYTPTRSGESNLDGNVTPSECQYMRVGSTVTVSGRFTADPTTTATTTYFELTLPISSNIGAVEDLAGVAVCGATSESAEITGVVANDTALITWLATDTASQSWSFTFTYQII